MSLIVFLEYDISTFTYVEVLSTSSIAVGWQYTCYLQQKMKSYPITCALKYKSFDILQLIILS